MLAINFLTYILFISFLYWILIASAVFLFEKLKNDDSSDDTFELNAKGAAKGTSLLAYIASGFTLSFVLSMHGCSAVGDADKGDFWFPIFIKSLLDSWG